MTVYPQVETFSTEERFLRKGRRQRSSFFSSLFPSWKEGRDEIKHGRGVLLYSDTTDYGPTPRSTYTGAVRKKKSGVIIYEKSVKWLTGVRSGDQRLVLELSQKVFDFKCKLVVVSLVVCLNLC